jgi:uncharacterized protein (DUF1778 family)
MSKSEFLQIRITPEDKQRIENAAASNHLDASTWARQVLLRALESHEQRRRSSTGGDS